MMNSNALLCAVACSLARLNDGRPAGKIKIIIFGSDATATHEVIIRDTYEIRFPEPEPRITLWVLPAS